MNTTKASLFIAISEEIYSTLINLGIDKKNIYLIPNGVEIGFDFPNKDKEDKIIIVCVGRLIERKKFDMVLSALSKVKDKNFHLNFYGDGPEKVKLLDQTMTLGLNLKTTFHGTKKYHEIIESLKNADVFIFPSESEGMSNALLEAMSCKNLVIARDLPVNQEMIKNNFSGLLFKDQSELDVLVRMLLDNAFDQKEFAKNAFKYVENNYSFRKISKKYIDIYNND